MAWLYRALWFCAVVPLLGRLWWRGRQDPDYRLRWRERFGRQAVPAHYRGGVLLHCASVGEVLAARPLVERLLAEPQFLPLVLTCTSPTGSRMLRQLYGETVGHLYFPFDLRGATRRFLHQLQPRLVLLLEREIWPEFLQQAELHGVPVVVVNARLSERSATQYQRFHALLGPALSRLQLVCAQDDITAARYRALGVAPRRLCVTGNIKSDVRVDAALTNSAAALRKHIGTRPVLTAGSTHPGEDEALIKAFAAYLQTAPDTLLVLVPRHPERFAVVARLLQHSGLCFVQRSAGHPVSPDTQVVLGDSMGELMLWYGVADACFIGGSLVGRGGHNPLEALCLDKPVLSGPHTHNFAELYQALETADALERVGDAHQVFDRFGALLADRAGNAGRIVRGRAVYQQMAGASGRTMAQLRQLLRDAASGTAVPNPRIGDHGADVIWADPELFASADAMLFDLAWWRSTGSVEPMAAGRGKLHLLSGHGGRYLLRHYYRGGLMARISRDLFLRQPVAQSRAMREFTLLHHLCAQGHAVPRAAAARYQAAGLCYRADILVQVIDGAKDIAQLMHNERPLASAEWQSLGLAVRRLHDAQVWHSDLNCHNLMLDPQGKAWIVDFDKCGWRAGEAWKLDNLARLLRSLRKELRLDPSFRWGEAQWQTLLDAYSGDPLAPQTPHVTDKA